MNLPCDCIEKCGQYWIQRCYCQNQTSEEDAQAWCDDANRQAVNNTPETDKQTLDPYPWNTNGPGRSHRPEVMYPCDDGDWVSAEHARRLERQRDAYAETLRAMAETDADWAFIRERHPELGNVPGMGR